MLLRSSSTPILNSWMPNSASSSPEPAENLPQLTRIRSVTMMTTFNVEDSPGRSVAARPVRESDLKEIEPMKKGKGRIKGPLGTPKPLKLKDKEKKEDEMDRLLSSSGLGEVAVAEKKKKNSALQTLVAGGGGGSEAGGYNGGDRSGSGFGSNSYDSNSWYGPDRTDAYYQRMIEANPGNSLLLSNYAKFLKEVKNFHELLNL